MKTQSAFNEKVQISNTKLVYVVTPNTTDSFGRKPQMSNVKIKEVIV